MRWLASACMTIGCMAAVPPVGASIRWWPSSGPGATAAHPRWQGFRPGERQLDFDHLLAGLSDIVYFVDPDLAARPTGLVAVRVDPPGQVVIDHGEDAGSRAAADGDDRLDFGKDQVFRRRRKLGWRPGHGQGQVDGDVVAVTVFVEDHVRSRYLRQLGDSEQIELLPQAVDDGDDVSRAIGGRG